MEFVLKIKCDGDAFSGDRSYEVSRILHTVADRMVGWNEDYFPMMDINGNRVGTAKFEVVS